jgi:hypothetical protein
MCKTANKTSKWVEIVNENEPSFETLSLVRKFSGRMTKARYKILSRYCRKMIYRQRCGHDYDCCGCVFAEYYEFDYKQNQVIIYHSIHRNY